MSNESVVLWENTIPPQYNWPMELKERWGAMVDVLNGNIVRSPLDTVQNDGCFKGDRIVQGIVKKAVEDFTAIFYHQRQEALLDIEESNEMAEDQRDRATGFLT